MHFVSPTVISVSSSATYKFGKQVVNSIELLAGLGVQGDIHSGVTVKHRSRVAADPTQPNLRQVHLIHSELFAELRLKGFEISAGQLGENITTQGIDLLGLPIGTLLHIGNEAVIEVTGLRNPCKQLDDFKQGLMAAVLDRDPEGNLIRKSGIMTVVKRGGRVKPQDAITIVLPEMPHHKLERV
jgi:MOSC domain-containing protein YiiM